MAGSRQPIELLLTKGKKHLTKEEIENRRNQEIKPISNEILPPNWLTKKQKEQFDEYSKQLIALGVMGNTDCDQLARYIVAYDLYINYSKQLLKKEVYENPTLTEQYLKNQDKVFKQCHTIASSLGMTISSRCKLVVPKANEEKPRNKFSKFKEDVS